MMRVMKVATSIWILALLIVLVHCDHAATADEPINEAGGTNRNPNEPEGFAPIIVEEWDSFAKYKWWHQPTNEGTTEIVNGRLVWSYPQGKKGGSVPGAKVALDLRHAPYEYHRDEGVMLSSNFHGHRSGVNKFRFWNPDKSPAMIVGFFGRDDSDLTLGMNSGSLGRLRWNSDGSEGPRNFASPTKAHATVTRGVPHTIETLLYIGTTGNADGWVKAWLDGVLVIDCRNLKFVNEGAEPVLTTIHFAPVWGGTGDTVPAPQTLTVERSYVSVKEADLRTATSVGGTVDAETPTAAGPAAPAERHSSSPGTTASSVEGLWPNLSRLKGPIIEIGEGFEAVELDTEPEPNGTKWTYQKEAWFDSGDVCVVEAPDAPASPHTVLRYRFREGRSGGRSPARAVNRGSKPYKHRYIGFYVRWSVPWDEHRVLDKILYWGEQDQIAAGQNPGQFFVFRQGGLIRVNLQFAQNYEGQPHRRDAHRMIPQPAAGEERLAATRVDDGKWHLIEIICNQSTDGMPNGRLRVWVDDVLQFDFKNVRFNPSRDALFRGLDLDPVWGGIGDRKEQTDYLYYDHLLMAGSNAEQE